MCQRASLIGITVSLDQVPPNADNSSAPFAMDAQYETLEWLRSRTALKRTSACSRNTFTDVVSICERDGKGFIHGVETCQSGWSCPVHSPRLALVRQREIGQALDVWVGLGGRFAFVTLTRSHTMNDPLPGVVEDVIASWARLTRGRPWREAVKAAGGVHWIRVPEVLYGVHGWHVHCHFILLFAPGTTDSEMERFGKWLRREWVGQPPAPNHRKPSLLAQDFTVIPPETAAPTPTSSSRSTNSARSARPSDSYSRFLSGYVTKATDYATSSSAPTPASSSSSASIYVVAARPRGVAPWVLLARARAGDRKALRLWNEFETAMVKRRQVSWSGGLKRLLFPVDTSVAVLSDDEPVVPSDAVGVHDLGESGTPGRSALPIATHHRDAVAVVSRDSWAALAHLRREGLPRTMAGLAEGVPQVKAVLDDLGIDYAIPISVRRAAEATTPSLDEIERAS